MWGRERPGWALGHPPSGRLPGLRAWDSEPLHHAFLRTRLSLRGAVLPMGTSCRRASPQNMRSLVAPRWYTDTRTVAMQVC